MTLCTATPILQWDYVHVFDVEPSHAADFAGEVDDPHSAYPDGFSIQVDAVDPVSFPMHITAELTSEPKPGTEMYGVLASHLEGTLDLKGKLTVKDFHLGLNHPGHFGDE